MSSHDDDDDNDDNDDVAHGPVEQGDNVAFFNSTPTWYIIQCPTDCRSCQNHGTAVDIARLALSPSVSPSAAQGADVLLMRRVWCTEQRFDVAQSNKLAWCMAKRRTLSLENDHASVMLAELGFSLSRAETAQFVREARAKRVPMAAVELAVEFDRRACAGVPLLHNFVMGDHVFEYGDGGHSELRFPVLEVAMLDFVERVELRNLLHELSAARNDRHVNEPVIDIVDPNLHPLLLPAPSDEPDESPVLSDLMFQLSVVDPKSAEADSLRSRLRSLKRNVTFEFSALPDPIKVRALVRWLPAEVDIGADGSCRFVSPINKLPRSGNERLYVLLERLLASFLPAFAELGLVPLDASSVAQSRLGVAASISGGSSAALIASDTDDDDDDDDNEVEDEDESHANAVREKARRRVEQRGGPAAGAAGATQYRSQLRYQACRRQFVVKVQSVALKPGEGYSGHWHVEGLSEEHVAGSAVYYCHIDRNLVGGGVRFRPASVPQPHESFTDTADVVTRQGRGVVFRNMPHRVRRIENTALAGGAAADEALRTFVSFFMVDPHTRLTSTANELARDQQFESDGDAKIFRDKLRVALATMKSGWGVTHFGNCGKKTFARTKHEYPFSLYPDDWQLRSASNTSTTDEQQ
jgi:hypothetical protein